MNYPTSRDRRALERRRMAAGKWFDQGKSQAAVARRFKVTPAAACQWYGMWLSGKDALRSKGLPGVAQKLSPTKQRQFKRLILKGAQALGYDTDFWTLERLRVAAKRVLKIELGTTSVWRTVTGLGFSCQRPIPRFRERDEAAIARWKRFTFPRLKKMG